MRLPLFPLVALTIAPLAGAPLMSASPAAGPPRPAATAPADSQGTLQAVMAGKDGRKVTGRAVARPTADGKGTEVTVTIDGDTPGATRPWHVHAGRCDKAGSVVGGGRSYPALIIDGKGQGSAKATLAATLPDSGSYYVNVHDAATAMGIIVACGDLVRR